MKSSILFFLFTLLFTAAQAQRLARAEYFIDRDPSAGKGVIVNFAKADSVNIKDIAIPMAGLTIGPHMLGFRVQDSLGVWSPTTVTPFSIMKGGNATFSINLSKLVKAEYFIDKDPSPGFGKSVYFVKADSVNVQNISIPMAGLANGPHMLGLRVQDSLGYWSPTSVAPFSIMKGGNATFTPNLSKLTRAEYFIDKDPSPGMGTSIFFAKADSVNIRDVAISTSGLKEGPHLLGFRIRDSLGYWSANYTTPFSIMKGFVIDTNQKRLLTKGEYFFGKDPGSGKGIAFKGLPLTAESWDISSLSITLPDTLTLGANTVTFRLFQDNGIWSASQTIPFDICLKVPAKPTATSATICGGTGTAKLTASGAATKQYNWYKASYGGDPLNTTSVVGDSIYTTIKLDVSTTFWVAQKTSGCHSSRTRSDVTVVQALAAPSTQNITRN